MKDSGFVKPYSDPALQDRRVFSALFARMYAGGMLDFMASMKPTLWAIRACFWAAVVEAARHFMELEDTEQQSVQQQLH